MSCAIKGNIKQGYSSVTPSCVTFKDFNVCLFEAYMNNK